MGAERRPRAELKGGGENGDTDNLCILSRGKFD
jgi:hypothetical protein